MLFSVNVKWEDTKTGFWNNFKIFYITALPFILIDNPVLIESEKTDKIEMLFYNISILHLLANVMTAYRMNGYITTLLSEHNSVLLS